MRHRKTIRRSALVLGLGAVLAPALAGCGGAEDDGRVAVSGVVTLDGQPLDDGHVTLRPLGHGPAVSGSVRGGEFHLSPSEGPAVGPHVVEVVAIRPTGRTIESPDFYGSKVEETANIIPPRYNIQSDLRIEPTPEGENAFRFELSSREDPAKKSRRAAGRGARNRSGGSYVQ